MKNGRSCPLPVLAFLSHVSGKITLSLSRSYKARALAPGFLPLPWSGGSGMVSPVILGIVLSGPKGHGTQSSKIPTPFQLGHGLSFLFKLAHKTSNPGGVTMLRWCSWKVNPLKSGPAGSFLCPQCFQTMPSTEVHK